MKNYVVRIILFVIVTLFACENKETIVETPEEDIKNYSSISYTELSQAPSYKQSTILCKNNDDLFRFGTTEPTQVFNLTSKSWDSNSLPDSSYSRWDGFALNMNANIYISAVSVNGNSYDILKYNPTTSEYVHTGTELPKNFNYPAFCKYNNQMVFLSLKTDSVFSYDVEKNSLLKIAENPFYIESDIDMLYFASGVYQNYFYVLGGRNGRSIKNKFYRLNLSNNVWEQLNIPQSIENKFLVGGSTDENMIMFSDPTSTYLYSFNSNEWSKDLAEAPIYETDINGNRSWQEWSFFTDGSDLYGSEVAFKKIWKISVE
jgi:hypothetical protein